MKPALAVYNDLKKKVTFIYTKLKLFTYENIVGRKLALPITETLTLALYKQTQYIATKKAIWKDFQPPCSYKTLVVNMNRYAPLITLILAILFRENRKNAHPIKHTDATDIPVCLNKNARYHKTMAGLAAWGHSGKGLFYGLKLHITSDLKRNLLSLMFTPGNTHGTKVFLQLNKDIDGFVVADAEYISEKLQQEFYQEHKRMLFAKPRKNMKKLITVWQKKLYDTRMIIELNFKNLKMFYGLISSLPRSINGYFANYLYAILAYALR
ncbi:MAG: transposase [Patescibacteria group bacterium]